MADTNPRPSEAPKPTRPESDAEKRSAADSPPPADAQAAAPAEPAADDLNHDIDQLRAQLDAAKDRALRFQAELDNYRKRVSRQMDEERRYAQVPLIGDLLPVLDNVGRAIEAAEKSADAASLLEGFRMVARQLETVLQRHHCTQIEALRQPFDPHLHEAILQQPSAEVPANTVLQVTQTGYRVYDRVVRPSQVIVSTVPPEANSPQPQESEGTDRQPKTRGV